MYKCCCCCGDECVHSWPEGFSPSTQHLANRCDIRMKHTNDNKVQLLVIVISDWNSVSMHVSWESVWNLRLNSPLQSHSRGNLGTKPRCVGQCALQCVGDFICGKNVPLWRICCCVTDAAVPPCALVSRSARCRSVQPPFPSTPQPLCGISTCKYGSVPPPLLSALFPSPALLTSVLPLLLYQWSSFIPSHPRHACVPPTATSSLPPPLFIPVIFSCLYLSTDLVPSHPPPHLPPFAAIPSNLHLSPISPPSLAAFNSADFGI